MKVWIVNSGDYSEEYRLHSIHSTKEKAKKAMKLYNRLGYSNVYLFKRKIDELDKPQVVTYAYLKKTKEYYMDSPGWVWGNDLGILDLYEDKVLIKVEFDTDENKMLESAKEDYENFERELKEIKQ